MSGDDAPRPTARRRLWLVLRLAGTAAGLTYVLTVADLSEVVAVFGRVPLTAIAAAIGLTALNVAVASVRWRILLVTYGSDDPPSVARLIRLYLVGLFYNGFFPGGVGGDVVRGIVSREAFGAAGVTPALTVVFVERVLGLTGLLALTATALAVRPLPGVDDALPWSLAGIGMAVVAVLAVAAARRLAPVLPGRAGRIAASVPSIRRPGGFAFALLLSVGTQTLVALSGHVLLVSVEPTVGLTDSLVIVPVAAAAAFFPFTVGGAGAREAAFVALCTTALSMQEADAAAASLLLWLSQLLVAGTGGILQLTMPVRGVEASS